MNKVKKFKNEKSEIYEKWEGDHINRKKQVTKVSQKLVPAFFNYCVKRE